MASNKNMYFSYKNRRREEELIILVYIVLNL